MVCPPFSWREQQAFELTLAQLAIPGYSTFSTIPASRFQLASMSTRISMLGALTIARSARCVKPFMTNVSWEASRENRYPNFRSYR